jgi:hypothetical protein
MFSKKDNTKVKELISAIKQLIKLKHMCGYGCKCYKMSREFFWKKGISLMLCTPHGLKCFWGNNFRHIVFLKNWKFIGDKKLV